MAGIKTYGRVVHSLVSRTGEYDLPTVKKRGQFMPGFHVTQNYTVNEFNRKNPCGLKYVDHCVGNVEEGMMNKWVEWYENVLEFKMFKHFDDKDISTEYSALMSKVMASGNNLIKMPINEPAEGKKKSQILEYLEWHNMTPGVQHLALRTDDELASVAELRSRGVDFLQLPDSYYEIVWDRVNKTLIEHGHEPVKEDHERIRDLGILVDADDEGYLLQLFTKPSRTARRSSSRSSPVEAASPSAKATSRPSSRRWNWSRNAAGTCKTDDCHQASVFEGPPAAEGLFRALRSRPSPPARAPSG